LLLLFRCWLLKPAYRRAPLREGLGVCYPHSADKKRSATVFSIAFHRIILASRPVSIGDFSKAGFFVSFSSMEKVKYKFTSTKSNNLFQQKNRKQKTIRTHKHTPYPSLRGELLSVTLKKLYSSRSLCSPLQDGPGVCLLSAPSAHKRPCYCSPDSTPPVIPNPPAGGSE